MSHRPLISVPQPHEAAEMFRLMTEEIEECAIFLMNTEGVITVWNKAAAIMKGYTAEEAVGQSLAILYTEEDQAKGRPAHNLECAAKDGYFREETWRKRKDGSLFWARIALTALRNEDGLLLGFSKITLDLTEHKRLEQCLKEKEETRRILDAANAGTWKWCITTNQVEVSPNLLALLDYAEDEVNEVNRSFQDWMRLIHPLDQKAVSEKIQVVLERCPDLPLTMDMRMCRKNGECRWFHVRADWRQDGDDQAFVLMGVSVDIHVLKQMQKSLEAEKERAQVTLTAITDGVTGWTQQDAKGRPISDVFQIVEEINQAPIHDPIARCLKEDRVIVSVTHAVLVAKDEQQYSIEYSAAPIRLSGDRPDGAVLVIHDVTESRGLLYNLGYQASHDALTGLLNRREFGVRLQRTLDRAKQGSASSAALLYMDLDQFKIVNDTCGHTAGDDLLHQLAIAYHALVRDRDTLARIGGDEFALVVEHCTVQEAMLVAHKVLETTRNFRYVCKGHSFQLGVSIGLIPIDGNAGTVEEALRLADHACYTAKETGRNRVFVQQNGDIDLERRRNDMHWVTRLGEAFRADHLQLFYQPIYPLGGKVGGRHYEILLRMKNEESGPISPTIFLPAAERYDVMPSVDRWVLNKSIEWLEANPKHVAELELCTINLSQRTLADTSFQQYAAGLIQSMSVPAEKLCFEITETGAIANMHNTLTFINKLKEHGCRFALDDFGTGMASFAYLKQIPVNYVKIDGSFIQMMTKSKVDFEMVRFTNEISHVMGRQTIAEYVSDGSTLQKLENIGVDFAQGFWLGKPQPLAV